ncbi:hypothetical protein BGY98DRAFT_988010 [Russula aff. rugulosa BPL654]|nr:hypothetical protein BGY98DRAFT_988010 [Russula aff. rugulosa BPL654]
MEIVTSLGAFTICHHHHWHARTGGALMGKSCRLRVSSGPVSSSRETRDRVHIWFG